MHNEGCICEKKIHTIVMITFMSSCQNNKPQKHNFRHIGMEFIPA